MADRTTSQGITVIQSGDPATAIAQGMPTADSVDAAIARGYADSVAAITDALPVTDGQPAWGIVDDAGTALDVWRRDGGLCPIPLAAVTNQLGAQGITADVVTEGPALWGVLDPAGKALDVIMADGTLAPTITAGLSSTLGLARIQTTQATMSIGTSLTAGANASSSAKAYPAQLSALTGQPFINNGWAGRNSFVIPSAWGALPFLTTAAATIPTSGPVSLTLSWEYGGARQAIIAGILGNLDRVDATHATFTPTTPPSAPVAIPAGTPVTVQPWVDYSDRIFLLECSRNDDPTLDPAVTATHMRQLIQVITRRTMCPRVLIMGEPIGNASLDNTTTISQRQARNAFLRNAFPDYYVPAFEWLLTNDCATYLGITWTSQDLTDIGQGRLPTQLRTNTTTSAVDVLHPNDKGYQAIAYQLQLAMRARGWII